MNYDLPHADQYDSSNSSRTTLLTSSSNTGNASSRVTHGEAATLTVPCYENSFDLRNFTPAQLTSFFLLSEIPDFTCSGRKPDLPTKGKRTHSKNAVQESKNIYSYLQKPDLIMDLLKIVGVEPLSSKDPVTLRLARHAIKNSWHTYVLMTVLSIIATIFFWMLRLVGIETNPGPCWEDPRAKTVELMDSPIMSALDETALYLSSLPSRASSLQNLRSVPIVEDFAVWNQNTPTMEPFDYDTQQEYEFSDFTASEEAVDDENDPTYIWNCPFDRMATLCADSEFHLADLFEPRFEELDCRLSHFQWLFNRPVSTACTLYRLLRLRSPEHSQRWWEGLTFPNLADITGKSYLDYVELVLIGMFMSDPTVPDPPLVGIETNPGPKTDLLISYLKNIDRGCTRVSRPKRDAKSPKVLVRKLAETKSKEKWTRHKFIPEAWIETGLDQDTRNFIQEALNSFKAMLDQGTTLHVDFTKSLVNQFAAIVDWCRDNLKFIYEYLSFTVLAAYHFAEGKLKSTLELLSPILFGFSAESVSPDELESLYARTIGKVLGKYDFLGVVKTIMKVRAQQNEFSSCFTFLMEVVRSVTVAINSWLGTGIPVFNGNAKLDRYFIEFYAIKKRFTEHGVSQVQIANELYILYDVVEHYFRESTDRSESEKIRYLLQLMKPMVEHCDAAVNPNSGPRIEPLGICVGGPTDVGKSSFTIPILLAYLVRVLPPDRLDEFMRNHNEFLFFRNAINGYWDGLRASHIGIIYDDFGQKKDVAGGDNDEVMELIRIKNMAPFHLHYAGIADKQRNYARPDLLYATTNRSKFDFKSIVSNEAAVRRFDIAVVQVPKKEYCRDNCVDLEPWNRRMDFDKVSEAFPYVEGDDGTFLATGAIEFIEWDFEHGRIKDGGRTYTFSELIMHCVKTRKRLAAKGENMLSFHNFFKEKWQPESGLSTRRTQSPDVKVEVCVTSNNETPSEYHDAVQEISVPWLESVFNQVPSPARILGNNYKTVCTAFGFLAACFAGSTLISKLSEYFGESRNYNGKKKASIARKKTTSSRLKRGGKNVVKSSKLARALGPDFFIEAGNNESPYGFSNKVIRRNLYTLKIHGETVGQVLFVKGRICVYPSHFNSLIDDVIDRNIPDDEDDCTFVPAQLCDMDGIPKYSFDWIEPMCYCETDYDAIFLEIPQGFRDHADITARFPAESAVKRGNSYSSLFPVRRGEQLHILEPEVKIGDDVTYEQGPNEVFSSHKLNYRVASQMGDCGSPIITFDKRFDGPTVLGIHTAGTAFSGLFKSCVGVLITQEMIDDALESFSEPFDYDEELHVEASGYDDGFSTLKRVQAPALPVKTKIIPSPLFKSMEPIITKPARLRQFTNLDGEEKDPCKLAKIKYSGTSPAVSSTLINTAASIIDRQVLELHVPAPWTPRLLTFEEAVVGVPGVDYCNAIDRSTSAGYPHNLKHRNGKKYWLGEDDDINFKSGPMLELCAMVEEVTSKAALGVRMEHVYMDCLKDERRPTEKVEQGKTRQFMACPIQLLLAIRMYYGDFIRHICQNKVLNGIAVGINPVSEEWAALARHLHPTSEYVHGAGDFSSFDANMPPSVMWKFNECAEKFYASSSTSEDVQIRRILFHDIVNSLHVDRDGMLYEFVGKNPSGQPATAPLNSYADALMLVTGWLDNKIPPLEIQEKFRWSTFGDDHVTGFPVEYAEVAGSVAMGAAMKKLYGYDYTDENKSGELVAFKSLSEITFLKRQFKVVDGQMNAPLELAVLMETLNWQKKTTDASDMKARVDAVLIELARHGRKIFEEKSKIILSAARLHISYTSPYGIYDEAAKSDVNYLDY